MKELSKEQREALPAKVQDAMNKLKNTKASKNTQFNPIKTIEHINQDNTLKSIYANTPIEHRSHSKAGKFDYDELLDLAKYDLLSNSQLYPLKRVFETFILISPELLNTYSKIKVPKVIKIEYNPIRIIKLINQYPLLKAKYDAGGDGEFQFVKLIESAKAGALSEGQQSNLSFILWNVIERNKKYRTQYQNLKETRRKIPLRYGKKKLEADIAKQDGVATIEQQTLLELAELETLKNTVSYRCIRDHHKGTNKISDDDHQKLQEAIRSFNNTLQDIL